tara:strand:- start:62 stop:1189 length:1128 start_codon:yes stop_codon:yes gene_type:complete
MKKKNKKKTNKKKILRKRKLSKKTKTRKKKKVQIKNKFKSTFTSKSLITKLIKIENKLNFNFNLNFIFKIDKKIESFFKGIESKINYFKILREQEIERIRLEKIEQEEKYRKKLEEDKKNKKEQEFKFKKKQLKEEIRLERERNKEIKKFLRAEQALIRKEQAEKQRKFLEELKIERQIEKFRIREIKELERLEKISLKEKREDYESLQERINILKEKYRQIRDQKIRERVEALGIKTLDSDDREALLKKEEEFNIARQKIELSLESFYRSANSLVFQLNRRHLTKNMSLFRCIDRRFENGEIFIKWDESPEEDWLILIYIKDNSPNNEIVIEDKSNPEKNNSYEFKSNEIFKASDLMVDSLTQLLARERSKKAN